MFTMDQLQPLLEANDSFVHYITEGKRKSRIITVLLVGYSILCSVALVSALSLRMSPTKGNFVSLPCKSSSCLGVPRAQITFGREVHFI
jgi:hypothetical protein